MENCYFRSFFLNSLDQPEHIEMLFSVRLFEIAVNGDGPVALLLQVVGQVIRKSLGFHEHQGQRVVALEIRI